MKMKLFLLLCLLLSASSATHAQTLVPVGVTASGTYGSDVPAQAIDGDTSTTWNSGGFSPQWIQLDLGSAASVSRLRLDVGQYPNGTTRHEIWGGATPGSLQLLTTVEGATADGQWLDVSLSGASVRYVRVVTTSSPSWVSWREMQVLPATATAASGLRYFGYYGSAMQDLGTGDYTTQLSGYSNITWISGDILSQHYPKLKEAADLNEDAVLDVFFVFFNPDYTLRADYRARWNSYADAVAPYIQHIAAFYPMDEPFLNGQNRPPDQLKRDLETVASTIKSRFPDKPVATIYAAPTVADTANLIIPAGYDWLGFDCYAQTGGDFNNCGGHSIDWYVETLKSRMSAGQRLMLVPEAVYFGTDTAAATAFEPELMSRADSYYALAQSDPVIVGVFPFIYQTIQNDEIGHWIGTESLPRLQEKWRQLGSSIVNQTPPPTLISPAAVTASGSLATEPPTQAIDGNTDTTWNSGGFSPQWIQLDLGSAASVSKLRLLVGQYPDGATRHEIWGGATPTGLQLLTTLDGVTTDGQWLDVSLNGASLRYLRVVTTNSPSWVSWREIQVLGQAAPPPALISPAGVTASGTYGSDVPAQAIDGDTSTTWNSGGFSPQWIQLDLGSATSVSRLRLDVGQYPNGTTRHEIWGGATPTSLQLLTTVEGATADGQWLDVSLSGASVRYVRVVTTSSPSWVSWREMQVYR